MSIIRRALFGLGGIGDEDASAVFADDDLLALADIHLALGRDAVEAASAGVALDRYDGKAVADIAADTLIGREQALVDLLRPARISCP